MSQAVLGLVRYGKHGKRAEVIRAWSVASSSFHTPEVNGLLSVLKVQINQWTVICCSLASTVGFCLSSLCDALPAIFCDCHIVNNSEIYRDERSLKAI